MNGKEYNDWEKFGIRVKDSRNSIGMTIEKLANETLTTDIITGEKTNITYPKAKIIDMFGFTNGLN